MMVIYGGFPVKLKTIVGEPIYVDPQLSVDEISNQVSLCCRLALVRYSAKFFHFFNHVLIID